MPTSRPNPAPTPASAPPARDDQTGYPSYQDAQRDTRSALAECIEEAVDAFRMRDPGKEWQAPLWELARTLKGYFVEGTMAIRAFNEAAPHVDRMGGWETIYSLDEEAAEIEFVSLWSKVRIGPGEEPLDLALQRAIAHPIASRPKGNRPTPKYDRFVSVALWLQEVVGDRPIMLPCEKVATLLQTTPRLVSMWRDRAVSEGWLVKTADHVFGGGERRATEFRVPAHHVEWLKSIRASRQA